MKSLFTKRWFLTILLAINSPLAPADQVSCPTYKDLEGLSPLVSLDRVAPDMSVTACLNDPLSTGIYGGLLLRTGAFYEALKWLEKSLLLDPSQKGVQADFAIALASTGDSDSSSGIAQKILEEPDVPEGLVSVLGGLVALNGWERWGVLTAGVGLSNNVDYAPSSNTIELTFGEDGVSQFLLAPSARPKTAGVIFQEISLGGQLERGGYNVSTKVNLREKRSPESVDSDLLQGRLEAVLTHPSKISFGIFSNFFEYGSGLERSDVALTLLKAFDSESCHNEISIRSTSQSYKNNAVYDGTVLGVGIQLDCDRGLSWSGNVSQNLARNKRVGGDSSGLHLSIEKKMVVGSGLVTGGMGFSSESDSEGFSEFLDRGNAREVRTYSASLNGSIPLTNSLLAIWDLGYIRQNSNLDLFNMSAFESSFGLQYRF